ncbi:MAG: glucose 1-dehydrogenase, partial [Methylococcales bacterium]|nr:glucose 1-dehydrogenase [Methylococcales bacterium]
TGASRGIGEAIARAYVEAGASVVISSRKAENIEPVAESINVEYAGRALAVVAHAGIQQDAQTLVDTAVSHFGRLDIAVNNAATNPHFGPILTADASHWDKIMDVNVKGYFWLCQAAAQQMIKQGEGGKIINNASIAGIRPGKMMGIYSVSKAAVIMMTKVLALELGRENIQANAIAPGFVKTQFSATLWKNPALSKSIVDATPAKRIAVPTELAGIAVYLASDASSFTTGEVFSIDGGYTL